MIIVIPVRGQTKEKSKCVGIIACEGIAALWRTLCFRVYCNNGCKFGLKAVSGREGWWRSVIVKEGKEVSGGQLDEVLVPYPANQVVRVILILREPELTLFADDIEDLRGKLVPR